MSSVPTASWGRRGRQFIWVLPFIAVALAFVRFLGHAEYYYTPDGIWTSRYKEVFVKSVSIIILTIQAGVKGGVTFLRL
uniref:Uncharacterized protein n=1 Tax=Panagrolaimus davidi TaxID=227884 RepID=A0A914Q526_9BILA